MRIHHLRLSDLQRFLSKIHIRDRFLLTAGTSGMAQRLIATGFGLLTTGLLTRLLGREAFGVWATLSVLPQWIGLADLGINQSLTTRLGHLFGSGDQKTSRLLIWSGFWTQVVIAGAGALLILALVLVFPVSNLFGKLPFLSTEDFNTTLLWLSLGTILTLPFRSYTGILMARQRPIDCAALGIFGSAAMLVATFAASQFSAGIAGYSVIFTLTTFFCCLVGMFWLFGFRFPELWKPFEINWTEGKSLSKIGFVYFLGGITWILNSTLDSLMLANMVGPGAVTDYNLTLKLFSLTGLITGVAGTGLASAYAEALGRGDVAWIRSRYRFTLRSATVIGIVASVLVALVTPWVVHLWSGGEAKPTKWMIAGFAFWFAIFPLNQMIAFLLSGLNRAKDMLHIGIATTLINIPLTYFLIHWLGASGAAAGIGISMFVAGGLYAHRKVLAAISELESETTMAKPSR